MKILCGSLLILAGLIIGAYLGVWVMFIGGICGLIEAIRAENVDGVLVGISVLKIMLAGLVGWVAALVLVIPGACILND